MVESPLIGAADKTCRAAGACSKPQEPHILLISFDFFDGFLFRLRVSLKSAMIDVRYPEHGN